MNVEADDGEDVKVSCNHYGGGGRGFHDRLKKL